MSPRTQLPRCVGRRLVANRTMWMAAYRIAPILMLSLIFSLVVGLSENVDAAPTPSPSSSPMPNTLSPAQQKAAADSQVAELAAAVAAAQSAITQAQAQAETASQQYAVQVQRRDEAQAAEQKALADAQQAQAKVDTQHAQVVNMVITAYESSSTMPGQAIATILSAPNLDALLEQQSLKLQLGSQQAYLLTSYEKASTELAEAHAAAQQALAEQKDATTAAQSALAQAQAAYASAQAQQVSLDAQLAAAQAEQAAAAQALALANEQVVTVSSAQEQALTTQYQAQAAAAAATPLAPQSSTWTPAIGLSVVNRALQWLGTPYAWAGGTTSGPTRGVAVDADSANDGNIIGFDCSGLVMYAWGPYLSLPHLASSQYLVAGSQHPDVTALQPGDLVFWSPAGGQPAISHVAIYIGNGNVVQAPHSGDVIKVTPLNAVESGYFGSTRPLT